MRDTHKERNETKHVIKRRSPIHGWGIFAKKDFSYGETVEVLRGEKKHLVNENVDDVIGNCDWIGLGNNVWVDPRFPFTHINHSCNPNVGIKGSRTFVALREIEKDEEITFDYSTTEEDARWFMKCSCGQLNCRKEIRSVHFIPWTSYRSYLPYMPKHFRRVYERYYRLRT